MNVKLGVNIDHVATLRQARGERYPSPAQAADAVLKAGADQITIHLREDRRHIQDTDVESIALVTRKYGRPLNLEMGCHPEITEIAVAAAPDWVCLVPENRQERTTEGGLDLISKENFARVSSTCKRLKEGLPNLKISLFLEADMKTLEMALELPVDAVEIHTGEYARVFEEEGEIRPYLDDFKRAADFLKQNGLSYHAGHGLTDRSLLPLVQEGLFLEYNIGHWIVSQALFEGVESVVARMVEIVSK